MKRFRANYFHNIFGRGGGYYMSKTGTIWQFVCALFPRTWRTLSPDALFTRIRDTQTPRICHTFVLSLLVSRSTVPRNAYFSWQRLNCQIVPGFALLLVGGRVVGFIRVLKRGCANSGGFGGLLTSLKCFHCPKNSRTLDVDKKVRRFPMEPFLETLWGPLVPISAY